MSKEFHQPDDVKQESLAETHVHAIMVQELPEIILFNNNNKLLVQHLVLFWIK